MKLKNALLALGACSVFIAPAMAQAGTTASASIGKAGTLSNVAARQSTAVAKKKKDGAEMPIIAGLGAAAAVGGIIAVADKHDGGKTATLGSL